MKFLIVVLLLLVIISNQNEAAASEITLDLGLWTHHKDRTKPVDKCVNEDHNLVMVTKDNVLVGGYKNSHCKQSFMVGYQHELPYNFSVEVAAVTGYPDSMHVAEGIVIIPTLNYRVFVKDVGMKFIMVPNVLVGVGFSFKL